MVSRRSILRGATGLAAAIPLAATLKAFAGAGENGEVAGKSVPKTLATQRDGLTSGSQVTETEFPLTHLALSWAGPAAAVRLRTSAGWGEWKEAGGCACGSDAEPAGKRRAILAASGAVGYEVRAAGGGTVAALELNTVDGPTRTTAPPPGTLPLKLAGSAGSAASVEVLKRMPTFLTRQNWGADESFRFNPDGTVDTPPEFFPVQTLTVHHTGFDDNGPDPAATVRAIYHDQAVTKDWGDVGYQLLIDSVGRVYEGRYSDPDPIPVFGPDLGPDGMPRMVNGAHIAQFNAGNIGVALLGDFTARQPTAAARQSLAMTLAILAVACRLDPFGTTHYVNPISGSVANISTISGHLDWHTANELADPTECPGAMFYPTLPKLREEVAALMRHFGPA